MERSSTWSIARRRFETAESGLVVAFSDISSQVSARQERERLLTAERVARESADAASRAKDEFLATVSHELRSPLNAMLGWARLLSGGRLNDETMARGLKSIEQNAKAQAQLVEDLLDVSRIISGKFRLNNEPIRVVRVIEAAIDSVSPAAKAKGVRLQVTLDADAGPVSGDAGRLQQVVWNLLSNAIKFTPRDGRVQVRLMRINSHIEIVVSDTGQGIDPAFLPYVFDRFRQADGSSTRSHGGLGLGLAIVRHITELHGGSVAADSLGKGQGATFTVRLPLMVIHTKQSDEERVHPRSDSEGALHFKPSLSLEGVRVLVVDDEPETLLLLSTVLTQCRASVKTAPSAEEGFKEVQAWRPNVIVSDIGMPGEDGYAFMKRVKTWAREAGTWIPAVALTAYARAEDRMKALASGYQIHVPKPVEPAELIAVLVSLVERPATPGAL
jgi:signal transduction histidine kinase/CheY-like chemotaxis protein